MTKLFENKEKCCGCSACRNICPSSAIQMLPDEEGFLYPAVNTSLCVKCGLCRKVCAFQNGLEYRENYDSPYVYALKHKSDEVVMNSSSGGAFTSISDYIIERGGIVYGAAHDENLKTIHIRASNKEDRNKCRGSKYVQSDLADNFKKIKEDLSNGKKVLFTGTPCQVAGLRKFLDLSSCEDTCLYTADLVCHGVPSPQLFSEYIKYCEKKRGVRIKEYCHRSKDSGWGHVEEAIYKNGMKDNFSFLSRIWRNFYYSHLFFRPSCYICEYANLRRPGDITIADYWGIEKAHPEFADKNGVSLVLINTPKGKQLFESIQKSVLCIQSDTKSCMQKNLRQPPDRPTARDSAWERYKKHGFEYIAKKYGGYGIKHMAKDYIKSHGLYIGILKYFKTYK